MTITYHRDLIQGSDEWHAARCGLLTASEMSRILTPGRKLANNAGSRTHMFELLAQRITGYVEPTYIGDDMLRGREDEAMAASIYCDKEANAEAVGFITNDKWGFTLGYSPDAIVGEAGLIEVKSRRQKYQVQTILEHLATGGESIPDEYDIQVQTGLMVSERQWCDFISYCGGMPMVIIRVYPDEELQEAIVAAATDFEARLADAMRDYGDALAKWPRKYPTERTERREMIL